jgi:hypothetical protein
MLRQRTTNRLAGLSLDLRWNDDVHGGGGFRVLEHVVEKRELMLFEVNLFRLGAEEFVLDTGEFKLEKAVLRLECEDTGSEFLNGSKLGVVVSHHINDVACSLPTS